MAAKAYFQLLVGCILFGLVGIFLKSVNNMSIGSIIFYKHIFGLIFIFIYFVYTNKLSALILNQKKKYLLLLGILNTVTVFAYFICIQATSLSVSILLLYTAPMYVTLLSPLFLKEKITIYGVLALIISIVGVLLIVNPVDIVSKIQFINAEIIGIFAGIISGICFAGVIMTIRYLKDNYDATTQLFWSTATGVIMLSSAAFSTQIPIIIENIEILIIFGFVNTALASLLYINGIAKLPAQTGSIIALMEPVSVIFFDHFLLKTPLIQNTVIGCILILLGATITFMDPQKNLKKF